MKANVLNRSIRFQWPFRIFLLVSVFNVFLTNNLLAKTAKEIDASVDVAVERFYNQVKGAEEFVKASKGMLVMPNVVKGASIVGREYGEGALRTGGKSVDYYNTVSGSIGLQIGGQKKDIILLFMTEEALKKIQSEQRLGSWGGWQCRLTLCWSRRTCGYDHLKRPDYRLRI